VSERKPLGARELGWAAVALAFGLVLLVALVLLLNLDLAEVGAALGRMGPLPLTLAFLTIVVHAGCSALKWALVSARIPGTERRGWTFYLGYTAVAGALASVFTVHLSSILVREVAVRAEGGRALEGAGASLLEQLWDLAVLVVFAGATAGWLLLGGAWWGWMAGAAVLASVAIVPVQALVRPQAVRLGERLARAPGAVGRVGAFLASPQGRLAFDPGLSALLWIVSLVRYVAMGVRAIIVGFAVGLPVVPVLQGYTAVQASQVLSLTPGNLGIGEWTWTGVLAVLGQDTEAAAVLSLVERVLTVGFFVLLALVVMALRLATRRRSSPA